MLHIIIVCGPDGSGKRHILEGVLKAYSKKQFGDLDGSIHWVANDNGIEVGVAKKISEADITKKTHTNSRKIEVLICSARTAKIAWHYCDLIQQTHGKYAVFLKRKEKKGDRDVLDDMLCRQILACINALR